MSANQGRGAYGLILSGPIATNAALRTVTDPVGYLAIEQSAVIPEGHDSLEPGSARATMADGTVVSVVQTGSMHYTASLAGGHEKSNEELVHPYLAPIAALIHRWEGRAALHAASLAWLGRGMLLVGEPGQGKTTTAAMAVAEGAELLTDDLSIIRDGRLLAGPRSVDVRPEAAALLGSTGIRVRGGARERSVLAAQESSNTSLDFVIHLEFASRCSLAATPLAMRLQMLLPQLYWPTVPQGAQVLLTLLSVPHYTLQRPRGKAGLLAAIEELRALASS